MDEARFDRFAKGWTIPNSRRQALGSFLGGTLAIGFGLRALDASAAQRWSEREIIRIIRDAARRHHQPFEDLLRVARCESNLDPRAYNPAGPYYGLFQFLRSTFDWTPYRDRSIYHPRANAYAAAWMWEQGYRDHWACQ
jgi:hypothetical protein